MASKFFLESGKYSSQTSSFLTVCLGRLTVQVQLQFVIFREESMHATFPRHFPKSAPELQDESTIAVVIEENGQSVQY